MKCACQERGEETLGFEPCGFHAEWMRKAAQHARKQAPQAIEVEQLRGLLRRIRNDLDGYDPDTNEERNVRLIDESGLLDREGIA